jgi:hypothetical protein
VRGTGPRDYIQGKDLLALERTYWDFQCCRSVANS